MNKENEKEFIEVEVIKDEKKEKFSGKAFQYGADYGEEKFKESLNDLKKGLYWKVFLMFLPQIIGVILFFIILFGLVYLVFDNPFDHIIAALILYFLIRSIIKFKKLFK